MTKRPETIDVHVWNYEKDPDNPVEELEAAYRATYFDSNGYHQYGVTLQSGEYLEIRIPLSAE